MIPFIQILFMNFESVQPQPLRRAPQPLRRAPHPHSVEPPVYDSIHGDIIEKWNAWNPPAPTPPSSPPPHSVEPPVYIWFHSWRYYWKVKCLKPSSPPPLRRAPHPSVETWYHAKTGLEPGRRILWGTLRESTLDSGVYIQNKTVKNIFFNGYPILL